jgi:heme A synthase
MRGLHRFTVFVTCATFVLIVAGALVTSNGAGLAAPDWPLSWGRVFPPMVGNLFYEHGHRLIATSVGLLTIALNLWLWRSEKRLWVRRLGLVALGAVIAQGLLGGLAAFAVTFLQLVLGATLRHSASWDEHLPTGLVLAHVAGAMLVTLTLGGTLLTVLRRHSNDAYLSRPAMLAAVLLVLQLGLGLATYLARRASPEAPQPLKPIVTITVAHVACGALVLATIVVLTLRVHRRLRPASAVFKVTQATARGATT